MSGLRVPLLLLEFFCPPSGQISINAPLRKGLVQQHISNSNRGLFNLNLTIKLHLTTSGFLHLYRQMD